MNNLLSYLLLGFIFAAIFAPKEFGIMSAKKLKEIQVGWYEVMNDQ